MNWLATFVPIGTTLIIGVIGYFLKRTVFSKVDKCECAIEELRETSVKKSDHKEQAAAVHEDIEQIKKDYTPRSQHEKDNDMCRQELKEIKERYITREDFFREQAKTEKKLDRIMDILLEMKESK